ncbi:MAG: amino acid ABC transporter substrate-binding protein [Spirochaetota bacterium]
MTLYAGRRSTLPTTILLFFLLLMWALLPVFAAAQTYAASGNSREPIKIGASLSLTGIYREPSHMIKRGYELWVQETNANGGLLGRPLELQIVDDKSDVETARRIYQRFVDEQVVDLLFAPYGTPITLAVSEITEKAGYVLIAGGASGMQIWDRGYKYVFGVYSTADRYFIGFLDIAARHGIQQVSIIHENNPFNIDAAAGAVEWAAKFGIELHGIVDYTPGQTAAVELVRRADPNEKTALIISTYPDEGHAILKSLTDLRHTPAAVCMTIAPLHPMFAEQAGDMAEGVFGPSQWEPEERIPYPGTRQFISAFLDFAEVPPSYHAGSAFATGQVFDRAITETGSLDNAVLRDYISAMDTVTVIGRFKVDSTGKQIGHNPILIQWQDRKKEIVYPFRLQTAEPRF